MNNDMAKPIKTLNDYTWGQIAEIAESGIAETIFRIGDEKTDRLYTGEILTFVIVGFNHDELENGGKAGITFALKNVIDGKYEMHGEDTNLCSWRGSKMRTVYMERLFLLLPLELRSKIKPVIKMTGGGGHTVNGRKPKLVKTVDRLFLFSANEVFGTGEHEGDEEIGYDDYGPLELSTPCEDTQYPYFADEKNVIKYRFDRQIQWWLRSPQYGNDIFFCFIYTGAKLECEGATNSEGLIFGFCL